MNDLRKYCLQFKPKTTLLNEQGFLMAKDFKLTEEIDPTALKPIGRRVIAY
jgi:hypothetical protein